MAAEGNISDVDSTSNQPDSTFAKHARADAAIATDSGPEVEERKGMSWGVGLLEKRKQPDYELNVDRDFMYPFMIAVCLTLVVGFQTRGFTKDQPQSLLVWPKVKKRQKVIHKHVVKGQNSNEVDKKED
eukprot:scaffold1996_cov127-Cylindrotheca_fusiformis.AAC.18